MADEAKAEPVDTSDQGALAEMSAAVVAAYVTGNQMQASDILSLIAVVHTALDRLAQPPEPEVIRAKLTSSIPIRRYQPLRFKALHHDPELLLLRPATAATEFDDGEAIGQDIDLMAVHTVTFSRPTPPSRGGPRRTDTVHWKVDLSSVRGRLR